MEPKRRSEWDCDGLRVWCDACVSGAECDDCYDERLRLEGEYFQECLEEAGPPYAGWHPDPEKERETLRDAGRI